MSMSETAGHAAATVPTGQMLKNAWENLDCSIRKLRSHEAAARLGVSEGTLIASLVGSRAIRLRAAAAIIAEIPTLGEVTALTRNAACIHEKNGPYRQVSFQGKSGLVLGGDIDLRLFPAHWHHAFAVFDQTDHGIHRSLQFFDAHGVSVHKIHQRAPTDTAAFDRLIETWRSEDQTPEMAVLPPSPPVTDRPDAQIDDDELRRQWAALQDTHDFFTLLRRLNVGRRQALRLAGPDFARRVATAAAARVLDAARATATPIMVFVGNPGCIQIHSGIVENIGSTGPWLNVMDPGFRLHLRQDMIADAFVVRKPTTDGDVTSLELFDAGGFCLAQLFGTRKPGTPERTDWRAIVSQQ